MEKGSISGVISDITKRHSSDERIRPRADCCLMSPPELGEHLKPFVFLGLLEADMRDLGGQYDGTSAFWLRDDRRVHRR